MMIKERFLKYIMSCTLLLTSQITSAINIEVQALFTGKVVVLINGQRHILSTGQTSPEGVKMLSANSKVAILEINGQSQTYALGNRITTSFKKRQKNKVHIAANKRGMYLSHGSINGQSVHFLVDTGATSVAISARLAKKLGILYRVHGTETRATTASGVAKAWAITLKNVSLGSIKQKNVKAVVVQGDYPSRALLGMSFLDQLRVKKISNQMILEQRL